VIWFNEISGIWTSSYLRFEGNLLITSLHYPMSHAGHYLVFHATFFVNHCVESSSFHWTEWDSTL